MFIFSIFAFWRGVVLSRVLDQSHPDAIWMHSVVRYIGFWGISAVNQYCRENPEVRVLLSHHDVGWIAPFPQDVTDKSMIPISPRLADFVRATHGFSRLVATSKWCYLQLYRKVLPTRLTHIIFAPFLEKHIQRHFPRDNILLFPHSYDETLFHP